jgi:hypothetical protein
LLLTPTHRWVPGHDWGETAGGEEPAGSLGESIAHSPLPGASEVKTLLLPLARQNDVEGHVTLSSHVPS